MSMSSMPEAYSVQPPHPSAFVPARVSDLPPDKLHPERLNDSKAHLLGEYLVAGIEAPVLHGPLGEQAGGKWLLNLKEALAERRQLPALPSISGEGQHRRAQPRESPQPRISR